MELKTMSAQHYEEAIRDHVTVKAIREYLYECKETGTQPNAEWLRYLLGDGEKK